MAVKSPVVSTLNPNAPLFVPAAYIATEDFSPEWWTLVHTCPAFRDYWLHERYCDLDDVEELEFGEICMDQDIEDPQAVETDSDIAVNDVEQKHELVQAMDSLELNEVDKDPPKVS